MQLLKFWKQQSQFIKSKNEEYWVFWTFKHILCFACWDPRWVHTFYFRGFVDLVILLSLLSSYVVFVLKFAWPAHVTLRKNNKTQAAVAPLYFGSRHAHNTRKESTDSSRRNVAGAILYCHRYKRSYGMGASGVGSKVWVLTIGVLEVNPELDSVRAQRGRARSALFSRVIC